MTRRNRLLEANDPRAREISEKLQDVRRQLASLTLAPASTDPTKTRQIAQRVKELTELRETLERQQAGQLTDSAKQLQTARRKHTDLIDELPAHTVFVDLVYYVSVEQDPQAPGRKGERATPRYAAFILGRGQDVARVELGPADPIDLAVEAWRQRFAPQHAAADVAVQRPRARQVKDPDVQLRKLVWEPCEKLFPAGTTTVSLCPNGQLTAIVWNALPGRKPGSVLLEDYALTTVPNGQFLLGQSTAKAGKAAPSERLLIVGGVHYGGDSSAATRPTPSDPGDLPRGAADAAEKKLVWQSLPGSLEELQSIAHLAGSRATVALTAGEAGEDRVLAELPKVRFAHFATHGFFLSPRNVTMVHGFDKDYHSARWQRNPLVMSGLVLAGANRPQEKRESASVGGGDGILTAEEIVGLDLSSLDLAVLSACETGLGAVAGGEGVLGLQRAFHVAGTKDVVASLWKVDDYAAAALMALFYEKLWVQNKPPIEALREAQLEIYRNPDLIEKLADLRAPSFKETVKLIDDGRRAPDGKTTRPRLWAAWVLSGLGR
jgi:CHAT domain-containing protein